MISLHLRRRPADGAALELGRWYIGIEFSLHPAYMLSPNGFLFLPQIFAYCVRVDDYGEPFNGRDGKQRGGHFRWTSPFGFSFELLRR